MSNIKVYFTLILCVIMAVLLLLGVSYCNATKENKFPGSVMSDHNSPSQNLQEMRDFAFGEDDEDEKSQKSEK